MSDAIRNRVVLVTGGASGIGRGIAEAFAAAGARLALSYATSAAEAGRMAEQLGALALPADLTQPDGARTLVAAVKERLGPVEILVANAGGLLKRTPVVECDLALWSQAIALNLTSVFLSCQAVLPDMLAARRGCIVTVSSLAGHDGGGPGASHYGAAKGGVIAFTKALAKEVGPQGVRVNGIAPGLIATRFHDTFSTAEGRRATVERTPLRREGTPADVAGAALFLASDQAGFIAGETIEVNGGLGLF
jgi:3-oxoacyl-[acyl-carrier protein] reductase